MLFAGKESAAITFPHTYSVGPLPCDYRQIQDAIDVAASTGDTVALDARHMPASI